MQSRLRLNLEPNQLQRGRACEGAEIAAKRENTDSSRRLQRGRACEGAEMGEEPGGDGPQGLTLQRGRACEGAEISPCWLTGCLSFCFNGAAPVRARK